MPEDRPARRRSWPRRFQDAFRGVYRGIRFEVSFLVHFAMTAAVVVVAAATGATRTEWCLLLLCIFAVLAAELFNTAVERFAKVAHLGDHPDIRDCLDISSGAVLTASVGAAIVGALILVPKVLALVFRLLEA